MFYSLPSYLEWYVESCSVLGKAKAQDEVLSEPNYDLTMRRLLEELIDEYSPFRFVTESQFVNIYKAVMRNYGEYEEADGEDVEEISADTEGLMGLYDGLFDSGQLCEPIRTKEMARRLGVSNQMLINIMKANQDRVPTQYAWRVTPKGGWRFDPAQTDNFKRWLMNNKTEKFDENAHTIDMSHMVRPRR